MKKKITIKDIAEKAGVSINTVSRALNGKPDVSPSSKEKILRVADELNYKPNRFARGLRSKYSGTIGVVVADITNPFFGALIKGIQRNALRSDYSTIFCETNESSIQEEKAVEFVLQEKVDGILLTPAQEDIGVIKYLKEKELDFVLVARHFDQLPTDYVIADDVKGGFLATKHLIEEKCQRILHIQGPTYISSSKERLKGYRRALRDSGIPFAPELVTEPAITMKEGYEIVSRIISEGMNIDGIFAFSDYVALGALRALQEGGMKVPEDVALVGYDDIDFASYLGIPLTTVRMPKEELGHRAFELLCGRIRKEVKASNIGIMLDVDLIVRKSSLRTTIGN